ncbi:PREDICTED: microtubule-associated protein futsch isoform X7 [Bactrocera latifrons]|uniref:microtubule-associated protein futsch isoform X7 n=1 Tax=Bactrocera latifrons TaxID=174628 RepID=UPI0008DD81AD|nr:PREDICTED: microtubule-associated protein futsch isoform X7 [Bactrocera latifrons]
MVISNPDAMAAAATTNNTAGDAVDLAHPSGIPRDRIDNIMSGISNTGDVKMNNHRKKLRQRFDIIKKLGQGTYGKVQLGINKETGQEVAIKTIKKCKIEAEADLVRIRREVQIMSSVQHPNIIHIYEVFENREKMVLVMEFAAGGELYDYLSERKVLTEEEARRIFRQVATAVYYCHKHKICHRDLKLENILLDEHGNAKIADFGLSNVFDEQNLLSTFCGSPLYASPEIVEGTPYQGPEVDCWSLGVLLYTLVYGSMPFDGSNFKRLVKQISQGDYYEPKKPSRASTLIRDMLTVSPRKRATIEQICAHWWVNENDNVSCLDLAEELATQTPVRLDVLLSLTPAAVTADQLVVPSADAGKGDRVPRSHSVGSIRDMGGNTEAERRILDMVAAGGEAALMPSPTRTITPTQSPVQSKRKLETTVSTENAHGAALKKKDKLGSSSMVLGDSNLPRPQEIPMETEEDEAAEQEIDDEPSGTGNTIPSSSFSQRDMEMVGDLCEQLITEEPKSAIATPLTESSAPVTPTHGGVPRQKTISKLESLEEAPEEKDATKVIKKFVNKHKTADLVNAIGQITPTAEKTSEQSTPASATTTTNNAKSAIAKPTAGAAAANNVTPAPFVRKCSLQDEGSLSKFNADRRKSRVLETTEKLQQMNTGNATGGGSEKPKKFSIPGVSVGSFKKEFERKATNPPVQQGPTPGELRAMEEVAAAAAAAQELEAEDQSPTADSAQQPTTPVPTDHIESSDSKNSVASLSLEDARRSMENSIALLRQAQSESSKEVDQLCAQTENIEVSEASSPIVAAERERKLKNARAIIGNAIQPASPGGGEPNNTVKTSTATITLKSATLPRRKPSAKTEIQLEIKPRIVEQPNMRFTTEMQHPVADLRSAPPREGPAPYSPIKTMLNARATSLEPKEHIIPIQRPQVPYARTTSNTTTRSGSLSRQSTNDSESDTTTTANMSQSTVTGSSQPIKKSPREFIIPIAMEGGGFITPREGSIEPSESSHTASSRSTFNRLRPTRRIGSSLLNDSGIDDNSPFQKFRTSSGTREVDEEPRFTLHRLRSSRPVKKLSQENDSQSSGEEDDDDGFEILTAENLFSTLLQRVHALTHRMNVDKDLTAGFSNSGRLLSNMRHGPFWNQEPFGSRLNSASGNNVGAPWRHSMSRDLGNDMDSIFSRTGATLPRGTKGATKIGRPATIAEPSSTVDGQATPAIAADEPLDLADLDLSRLRLSKKDLETLSSITPGLPKCFQEQLLAKLPPTQARKLSRTLSMQGGTQTVPVRIYKRSQSGGRGVLHTSGGQDLKEKGAEETASSSTTSKRSTDSSERRHYDPVYRRSLSRTRYDYESSIPSSSDVVSKSRSSSICRDDYGKSMCSTYTTDINDRYKYYSPYLNKTAPKDSSTESGSVSPQKRYSTLGIPRETISSTQGRPPSGCLSPPIISADGGNSSLRRRSSQKRISRFLRPDFFDEPLDENPFQREKKQRERETQSVLREIRERSREPSRERCNYSSFDAEDAMSRKNSLPNAESSGIPLKTEPKHVRNKSMELYSEYQPASSSSQETIKHNRRNLSRPREITEELRKNELADKILEELQLLSATRTQQDQQQQQLRSALPREISVERSSETTTKSVVEGPGSRAEIEESSSTIKKIKKIKPKDKPNTTESSTDADATVTTSVVKKVKKIVRKTETTKTTLNEAATANSSTTEDNTLTPAEIEQSRRESKLKRPKSYPTKEPSTLTPKLPNKPSTISEMTADSTLEASNSQATRESRLIRPKSYPASKLTPPKESRKVTRSGAAIPTIAEGRVINSTPPLAAEEKFEPQMSTSRGAVETSSSSDTKPTTVKKIVKVSKKSKLAQPLPVTPTTPTPATTSTTTTPAENSKESSPVVKEKSPEKKPGKGLLYAIGQKFEKLRDSAMSKEKKSATSSPVSSANGAIIKKKSPDSSLPDKVKDKSTLLKKKKSLDGTYTKTTVENNTTIKPPGTEGEVKEKPAKSDKRSRIDAVIRSLRERSVPRSRPATETNYIKRAVSVEDMPGTFNKNAVNRVLGLFKRNDKEANGAERRVQSTRSTSNIERQIRETSPSPIYQNTGVCNRSSSISAAIAANLGSGRKPENTATCSCEIAPTPRVSTEDKQCVECLQDVVALQKSKSSRDEKDIVLPSKEMTQGNKDKRKGLMLDLTKLDKIDNTTTNRNNIKTTYMNGNGIYSNLPPYPGAVNSSSNNSSSQQSMDNATNNNNSYMTNNNSSMQTSQTSGYRTSSTHEINRNHLLTPSTENIANYSSDSRSYQDDCASSSTFLSPTEEPELYFDNWSVCSEDNYMLHASPSPTVSRLSRASQLSSPTRGESSDPNESVIDRIKRRSFYCRFNDKKPKRTSSIVGPSAVRDYYREQQAAVKARSSTKVNSIERAKSPDITQEFFRPLKLSPVGTELKPPIYKAPLDYATNITKPRKSLNDIRPTTSPSLISKRYGSTADSDYMSLNSGVPIRYKSSASSSPYESKGSSATGGLSMGVGTGIGAGTGIGGSYYNTYSPKRRSSYTFNGTLPSGATLTNSTLDGYATVGRRPIRAYDHRTMSLLDPTTTPPSTGVSSFRREARTPVRDYTSSISRSSSRYRTSSATRSPTNI